MRYFITGTAGFIGFHLAQRLLRDGHEVFGCDGMTRYYDVTLKHRRHAILAEYPRFHGAEFMLEDAARLSAEMEAARPDVVVHLAAQAGVRYSLENPAAYVQSNLVGTFNIIEEMRKRPQAHLLLASTSSVYGANTELPFAEEHRADHPMTFYAATKKATEGMAHSYSHLFGIPTTAFRFFTVYGPWGRPDMALFKFTENTLRGKPIDVYNHGRMERDFTYIDDLVEAIVRLAAAVPGAEKLPGDSPAAPFRVVNIGNSQPVNLMEFISAIEAATGRESIRNYMPMQPGDVPRTWADTSVLQRATGFTPGTPVKEGVAAFVAWYREYYGV
jgi:UDP-glucuronate 4-epimerase